MPETHFDPFPSIDRRCRDRSDDDVTVSPRYLAGSAFTGDDTFDAVTTLRLPEAGGTLDASHRRSQRL
ncbi:MAG: hypothetical protein JO362_17645 [Streptomycetaceae bacterium]|nr:hypothetical protein [Streptomycetaceae bacterium]